MKAVSQQKGRLDRLRKLCLSLPEATEKEAWGHPTFRVRDKIFAVYGGDGTKHRWNLTLKAPPGAQSFLVEGDPERFFVPQYVGGKGWVSVYFDTRSIDWPAVEELVEQSYRLIAPEKLVAQLP